MTTAEPNPTDPPARPTGADVGLRAAVPAQARPAGTAGTAADGSTAGEHATGPAAAAPADTAARARATEGQPADPAQDAPPDDAARAVSGDDGAAAGTPPDNAVAEPGGPVRRSRWRWLWHEWTLAVLGGLALAVVLTWPTLKHPATTIPGDLGDPTLQAWQVAWAGHALLTNPLGLWHSNTFYPELYSYAYSDTLLGYAPAGMIGSGVEAAIVRYNVLFVLLHALAFIGAYALVRQLGSGRLGAVVAGVAWAYAPWRLAHSGHMNILSIGGIALSLAMLARGHGWSLRHGYRPERRRPGWVVAGWLVAAWQITLGFGIGLPLVYFLAAAGLVAAAAYGISWWRRRRRPPFGRALLAANLVGGAVFAATTLSIGAVYLKVVELNPQARRGLEWTQMFSPPPEGLLTAPDQSWLWGERHAAARAEMVWPPEMSLLPGMTLIWLAAIGLLFSAFRLRHRILLGLGVVGTALLALGSNLGEDGDPGYLTLSKHLPGWDALRTPGRMMLWTSLLLAVLAAGAITAAMESVRRRARPGAPRAALHALAALPLVLVLAESVNVTPHPEVPKAPAAMRAAAEPLLVLPLPEGDLFQLHVMLWSTDGFPRVPNGLAGFTPASQEQIRVTTYGFPDASSVAYLRGLGIRSVVVFPERLVGTPWAEIPARPVDGLGISRAEVDGALVFDLNPAAPGP
ncbi:MAG TPA: hypothetical protein VNV66_22460 [Pilimelia sp.]|nr:hypothetical protein [Pilimelia sp.]